MDGKILLRAFQQVFFFFLDFLELWLINYHFSKFSGKMEFFEFFDDLLTAAGAVNSGDRRQVVGAGTG